MEYNTKLWNTYTDENQNSEQKELSKFIYHTSTILGAKKICEVGCNVGNNLSGVPENHDVYGIDMNEYALDQAKKRYPSFKFQSSSIDKIPYDDSFFDVVFTRGVLIHIPQDNIHNALTEMLRISKKWVFNLEYFGDDGKMIDWKRGKDLLWYRNMKEQWGKHDVEIVTDVEIPQQIDSGKNRLTIIKK
jgi:ubiquinone/menaquinone biosynthesis C-methylase UbiE